MQQLLELKKQGKTNRELITIFNINKNLLGQKVNELLQQGLLTPNDIKKHAWNKGKCDKKTLVICAHCGKEKTVFKKLTLNHGKNFFCDQLCRRAYTHVKDTCIVCGKEYERLRRNPDRKYCSNKCKLDACRENASKISKEKYTSERRSEILKKMWRDRKKEILEKRNTEEYLDKLSQANKDKWTDDLRSNHSEICKRAMTEERKKQIGKQSSQRISELRKTVTKPHKIVMRILRDWGIAYKAESLVGPYCFDIEVTGQKILIEIQGDFYHANPKMYDQDNLKYDIQKKCVRHDKQKLNFIKEHKKDYKLICIWEDEIKNNLEQVEKRLASELQINENSLIYFQSQDRLNSEMNNIFLKPGCFDGIPQQNRIVLMYQPHFYEREKELWKDEKIRKKLIENRCKYLNKSENELTNNELLRGFKISGIVYGYSQFSPLWIKAFIEKYNVTSIYDPCAGWGHRLLGASKIKYIANDIDERTV
ncbi:very short patch repair endonuclease, partial [Candidatus Woesearchaeota archaeon]|nr:very short patch repair endonuclease [Candidatus Woesearchaeota archaeon]